MTNRVSPHKRQLRHLEKQCSDCRKIKPITDFTPRNKEHTKFKSNCKPCYNAYHRRWIYSQRILRGLGR